MWKLGALGGVALAVALSLAGPWARAEPEAVATLRVPVYRMPRSLDPIDASDSQTALCVVNLYDQLYQARYGAEPHVAEPCLADGMPQLSEDRRTVTIRLKQGVYYADDPCFPGGKARAVRAADVVFCLKRLMDPRTRSSGAWLLEGRIRGLSEFGSEAAALEAGSAYPDVKGLEAVDEHTIRIRLDQPWPQLVWALASPYASIYPPEAVAHHGASFKTHPVSSGPYRLESFDAERGLVLTRNRRYREELEGGAGPYKGRRLPCVSRVEILPFEAGTSHWQAFMEGRLDLSAIPKDVFETVIDQESLQFHAQIRAKGIRLQKSPMLEIIYDAFNMEDPVVGAPAGAKGLALRRAMSLAHDDDWEVKHFYSGRAQRVAGVLLREFPEHDPRFVNPWQRGPEETREAVLARARKLLADAGLPGGKGLPVIRKHIIGSEISRVFFTAYKRDMAEIGVRVEAVAVTWPAFVRLLNEGKAQTWGVSWGADYPDAQNFLQLFVGRNGGGGANKARFSDKEFDRLYEEASILQAGRRRTELYRRMQAIVTRECPWSLRYRRVTFTASHERLRNFRPSDPYAKYFKHCVVEQPPQAGLAK